MLVNLPQNAQPKGEHGDDLSVKLAERPTLQVDGLEILDTAANARRSTEASNHQTLARYLLENQILKLLLESAENSLHPEVVLR